MRKLVALSVALTAALALSACQKAETPPENTEVADETTPEAAAPAAETATPAADATAKPVDGAMVAPPKGADAANVTAEPKVAEESKDTPHTGGVKVAPGTN